MPILKTHNICLLLATASLAGFFVPAKAVFAQEAVVQTEPTNPPETQAEPTGDINQALEGLGVSPVADGQPAQQETDFPDMSGAVVEQSSSASADPPSQEILQDVTIQDPQLSVGQLPPDVPVGGASPAAVIASDPNQSIQPDDLFYDANQIAPPPSPSQQGSVSPRKVDPVLNPASTLIVVNKDYGKDSRQARMVSAERAMKLGRFDSALEIYDSLHEKDGKNISVLMGRAVALQRLGRDEEAMFVYQQVVNLDPDNFEARLNMLGLLGQRYPAVALQQLLELRDDHGDKVPLLAQIAVIQAQGGSHQEALKYLGMAASIEPKNPNHIFNMAVIADRAGDHAKAIDLYEKALEIDAIHAGGRTLPRDSIFERLAVLR